MELVNKILILRTVQPESLIIKQVFDNFNKMEHYMFNMFLIEPSEFNWTTYKQGFPFYHMYFGTDYVVNSSIFVNDIYQPLDFSLFPSDCEITNSTYSNTY